MEDWRQIQRQNFTNIDKLCEFLNLTKEQTTQILRKTKFPLNLPFRLANKIKKQSLEDPIFLQFIPLKDELIEKKGFVLSPVSDENFQVSPKLLHKYQARVLLLPSSACAMNCRFCFRRNYPYDHNAIDLDKELAYIHKNKDLFEVILSGGDPLSLSDKKLQEVIENIQSIPHIKLLRFHTRFPIGIPERISSSFLKILEKTRLQTVFILHINHPKELDPDVIDALKKIQHLGIPVLTHTVLLRGVNDSFETLFELFTNVSTQGIIPYYLNQLDKVVGTSHFETKESFGKSLMKKLRASLPGYAVPNYIREVVGEKNKTVL